MGGVRVFSVAVQDVDDVVPGIHGAGGGFGRGLIRGQRRRVIEQVDDWGNDDDPARGDESTVGGIGNEVGVGQEGCYLG